jgi:excisionase family DNA binding protein
MSNEIQNALMNYKQASEYTGLKPRHLRELRYHGKLASYKVGSRVLFKAKDLDDCLTRFYSPVRQPVTCK